jgi:CRP-like cAMP-binding protein
MHDDRQAGQAPRDWQSRPQPVSLDTPASAPPDPTTPLSTGFEHIWLFQGVPDEYLAQLAQACRDEHYVAGETIFREGDPALGMYVVQGGRVRIITSTRGREALLSGVGPGECFGEMGVVDGAPRSATAVAASLCAVRFVPTEPFLDLMERVPLLPMRMLVLLSERQRKSNELIGELVMKLSRAEPVLGE